MWGVDCGEGCLGYRKSLDVEGESGLLIVGKEVWDFGRLWMRRESVGIIETERCI